MELVDYVRVLRRRWLVIVLAMVVCAGLAYGLSSRRQSTYTASARLVVSTLATGSFGDDITRRAVAVSRATDYATYVGTTPAVDAALATAGYAGASRPAVSGHADGESPFITIVVSAHDPRLAAGVANAYQKSLLSVVAKLDASPKADPRTLSTVDPATVPTAPSSPRPKRDGAIGLGLGLLLGLGSAFVKESLDRTYKDADVLEAATNLTVLGVVPDEFGRHALPTVTHPTSGRAEAYRNIRTNVTFAGPETSLKKIIVTSATPGEGKTSVAANLAVSFALSGQKVALVDADLRRPQVAAAFGMADSAPGLGRLLEGKAKIEAVLRPSPVAGLSLVTSGPPVDNASELLGSARMGWLLDQLGGSFDVVIIDTPPILPVTDPLVLAVQATGVVLVVRLGVTSRERLHRALTALRNLDTPVLGLVGNGATATGDAAYGYGSRYAYSRKDNRKRTFFSLRRSGSLARTR